MFYQRLLCKNDVNGNPRRLYVAYEMIKGAPEVMGIYDDGYAGKPKHLNGAPSIMDVSISPSKYREMYKLRNS